MSTPFHDGSSLQPDPRLAILARSRRLSLALKEAAGGARGAGRAGVPAVLRPHIGWLLEPKRAVARAGHRFDVPVAASFLVVVLIPCLIATAYFALVAAGQYASEMRLSVRSGEKVSMDLGGSMTQGQDTLMVQNYLTSRALVEELDRRVGLRQLYSRPGVDTLSRVDPEAPIEELVRYWRQRVHASIDSSSGIVTITVRAFTAEDAQLVARTVLEMSEALVNDMSRRSRQDVLAQSESELRRAEERMKAARTAFQELRNEEGMLDPRKQAEGINKLLGELRMDRIRAQNELTTAQPVLSPQAPQLQVLRARLAAMDEQIAALEHKLTGESGGAEPTIASSITRFDRLDIEQKVAERQYISATTALERARMNADRQSVYLVAFVQPLLPQEARYPRRFWLILGFVVTAGLLWACGIGIATLVRDHMV